MLSIILLSGSVMMWPNNGPEHDPIDAPSSYPYIMPLRVKAFFWCSSHLKVSSSSFYWLFFISILFYIQSNLVKELLRKVIQHQMKQKDILHQIILFAFACNAKSFAIAILVFFFSFSFSLPFLDRLEKVFCQWIICCYQQHMWPRSDMFPWANWQIFPYMFFWLWFQTWVACAYLIFVWNS